MEQQVSILADDQMHEACMALEQRRQTALVAADIEALDEIFSDDLVHIHSVGLTHDKPALLAHIAAKKGFAAIERGSLKIRALGDDAAVMSGTICNHMRAPDGTASEMRGMVTQIVKRTPEGWKFMHFQLTLLK